MTLDNLLEINMFKTPELKCDCINKETKDKIKFDLLTAKDDYRKQYNAASEKGFTRTQRTFEIRMKETDLLIKEFDRIRQCP